MLKHLFGSLLLLAATAASAATVHVGTVGGSGEWGIVRFTHGGGTLTINVYANGFTSGPTGEGIDDSYLTLLVDDGSPLTAFTGTFVGENDDSFDPEASADGSTIFVDSFLDAGNLSAGTFLLAISHCCQSFNESRDIRQDSLIREPFLDYQLTFSRDVAIDGSEPSSGNVPEPTTALLSALALASLAAIRRRRAPGRTTAAC